MKEQTVGFCPTHASDMFHTDGPDISILDEGCSPLASDRLTGCDDKRSTPASHCSCDAEKRFTSSAGENVNTRVDLVVAKHEIQGMLLRKSKLRVGFFQNDPIIWRFRRHVVEWILFTFLNTCFELFEI